jgi:hypothetical protein
VETNRVREVRKDEVTDEDHGVVSRLSSSWVLLSWVTDNSESWLVSYDLDVLDLVEVTGLEELLFEDESQNTLDGSGRLVLVKTKLKVLSVDGEVISVHAQDEVERRLVSLGWLEVSENSFWVSEDVLWTDESEHGSLHGENSGFGGDGSRGSLRVTQLFTGSDGSKRNVVSNGHSDGRLDLLETGTHESPVSNGRGDGTVDNVVNPVGLEGENFCESTSDLIREKHGLKDHSSVDVLVLVSSSYRDWVEIVVSELSSLVTFNTISKSEDCSIGVPFSHSRRIGTNGFFGWHEGLGAETSGVSLLSGVDS